MSDAPEMIWAWTWNTPGAEVNGKNTWASYKPLFAPYVTYGRPDKNHWLGVPKEHYQSVLEYRRADLPATDAQAMANPKVQALMEALIVARDGLNGLVDSNDAFDIASKATAALETDT